MYKILILIMSMVSSLQPTYGESISNLANQKIELQLSANETQQVKPDILIVNLRFEVESSTAKDVQKQLNHHLSEVMQFLKEHQTIQISTQRYSVYKNRRPRKGREVEKEKIWHGSQSFQIRGSDTELILDLTEKLQDQNFIVDSPYYVVSQELTEKTDNILIKKSIKKLLSKAELITKQLGKKDFRLVNINVNSHNNAYLGRGEHGMLQKSMDMEMVKPQFLPKNTTISTKVNATIEIRD